MMGPTFSGLLVMAALATSAHADNYKCTYKGSYAVAKSKASDAMELSLEWQAGSTFTGTYKDKDGSAEVSGTCDGAGCTFAQHYKVGKLAGKSFYWAGLASPTSGTTDVKGTWGYKATDRTNGGTWQATGSCTIAGAPAAPGDGGSGGAQSTSPQEMFTGTKWTAFYTDAYYVVGGCSPNGVGTQCTATVTTPKGKVVKKLTASTTDDMGDGNGPDRKELDKLVADLEKLLKGAQGNAMIAHDLGAGPYTQDDGTFKYDAKKNTLTVTVGKTVKKIAGPKIAKGMKVDKVTLFLFNAGSPPAATLTLSLSEIEGSTFDDVSVTSPIPDIGGGD